MGTHYVGIDLGGTKVLVGVFDSQLKLVSRAKQPSLADGGPGAVFSAITLAVTAALTEANVTAANIIAMGFGIPGQIEPGTSVVRFAPNLNWRNVDVRPLLPPEWTFPIVLENDVRMGTFGEYSAGAAQGSQHVLGIFAGTGVGGGLILNGKLHTGFRGHGGEIGHIVLHWTKGHTLEKLAGRKNLMAKAKDRLEDAPKWVKKEWKDRDPQKMKSGQIADLYNAHDPIALGLVENAAHAIGVAVGSCINLLSPEVIVIGGGVAEALGADFTERIWEIAQRYALPGAADGVRCVPAALGDNSGITGSAAYAKAHHS